ncbi:MAG: hypothetical protein ACN4GM_06540 [Gammaproteobacteria bacterium]
MSDKKMTKQEAIEELRKEAQELDDTPGSFSEYARNAYKARIRRELADKLEQELIEDSKTKP